MSSQSIDKQPTHSSSEDRSLKENLKSCSPVEGEDIVITGMSGQFPDSHNVYHYRDNLLNKVDMVSDDFRRWKATHPEVPKRSGKLYDISKFDLGFFGIRQRQVNHMDPINRLLLERTFEMILDAGYHPSELVGTRTGVFIGACMAESETANLYIKQISKAHSILGSTRSMLAQQISYFFKFEGPSCITDTACSSSMYALETAYRYMTKGLCDNAVVAGASLTLHPLVSLQFARLGVLGADGACKAFDNAADGYARSEGIGLLFLQKSKNARRIYAHVIHTKCNSDGFKEQGITYPSSEMQIILMKEIYQECNVDPTRVKFVEAHGTGTVVGDPEELNSLDAVFCTGINKPLYIGSVKSCIGHSEPAAAVCALIKVLVGMECGFIPPNIHFNKLREGIPAFEKGRIKVVTDKMPWPDNNGLAGVNSFGFGGSNAHALLRWNKKEKSSGSVPADDLPRLVCVSGRTKEAVSAILDDLKNRKLDVEFVKLLHTVFGKEILGHPYRGYSVLSKFSELQRSVKYLELNKKKLLYVFTNFDQNWLKVGPHLLEFPVFARTMEKIHKILFPKIYIDIVKLISNFKPEDAMSHILGTMAIQICLAEVLRAIEITPNSVIGFGTGELIAAYFEEFLSLDAVIFSFLYVALAFGKSTNKIETNSLLGKELLSNLRDLIPQQSEQFETWLPLHQKNGINQFHKQGSAEYFVENIITPISFKDEGAFPEQTEVLIIGPKIENVKSQFIQSLVGEDLGEPIKNIFTNLGRLYENGVDMRLDKLYPKVSWPVGRGTPMVSPLIKWVHNSDWFVPEFMHEDSITSGLRVVRIVSKEAEWNFITGHVIDGRNLFPATGYLVLVWETLAIMLKKPMSDVKVVFKNIKFIRATNMLKEKHVDLIIMIQKGVNNFEITEGGTVVVTGKVYEMEAGERSTVWLPIPASAGNAHTLSEKDIYKELRIRGYNYSGMFRGLKECSVNATKGLLTWNGDWITFMDNMVHIMILQVDTKNLYVPTGIQEITIDYHKHMRCCGKQGEKETIVPVYVYQDADIIRSGGINIKGLNASAISRRKHESPVLEVYKFLPNEISLPLVQSVRTMIQIILENKMTIKVKSVEVRDPTKNDEFLLSPIIQQALLDTPLIQTEIILLSKTPLELPGIRVEDKKLSMETNSLIVVVSNVFEEDEVLNVTLDLIKDTNGYIISREDVNFDVSAIGQNGLHVLCVHRNEEEILLLLRKSIEYSQRIAIDISDSLHNFDWLPIVQNAVKESQQLILYSQNGFVNGILGFVNCLRREPNGSKISCFFIIDDAPKFDITHPFYTQQVQKNLGFNVFKDGKWGTYRHLLLEDSLLVQSECCYGKATVRGDLSSLRWMEGPLTRNTAVEPEKELVYVYYSALNFRDVMTASGRISYDSITTNRIEQECMEGLEFSGRDASGKRVMGIVQSGALSSLVVADSQMLWTIPDEWSLEDAATVPVVYATVIYALILKTSIKHGQSILIHSATGGVGQAALNLALHYGCNIFVTVGTEEKREYLRKNYPQIKESQIGNSRNTSFEQMVSMQTNGRGVDIVLNSLAEEKLIASVRCLAPGGNFLEIGKFDMANDNELGVQLFAKQSAFHGVLLDKVYGNIKEELTNHMKDLIKIGAIKPLSRTIFKKKELSQAFRYMATGKHIGKVLIRVREEEEENICPVPYTLFKGIPRYFCYPENTYIVIGGLGGFGLQLTDWLVVRGARKIILNSRSGIRTGHQAMMIHRWRDYGSEIVVRTDDMTSRQGCVELIDYANSLGPVKGIYNLAVVLKDALLENQTVENYKISLAPKAVATQHLDAVTREKCPQISDFVVFSSLSGGRGIPGQTNYGMSNSIMERICEIRKADGYPALAIQWGAVGDVGLVADMQESNKELIIGGTRQQKISSCLQVLDNFLRQNETIVSSMVVAEKCSSSGSTNIVNTVAGIIGIRDLKNISLHSTFPELGMDSMTAVEIKQTLEREYEIFLSPQDMRTMTFDRLQKISNDKLLNESSAIARAAEKSEDFSEGLKLLLHLVGDETYSNMPVVRMNTLAHKGSNAVHVFVLPGIEGTVISMEPLAKNLNANATCLQYCIESDLRTIEDWAKAVFPHVDVRSSKFVLIAHSFGCVVATELVRLLEDAGLHGKVVFIDGSPGLIAEILKKQFEVGNEQLFQTGVICAYMTRYLPITTIMKHEADILKCTTLEDRIKLGITISPKLDQSPEYLTALCIQGYRKMKACVSYTPNFDKLKSEIKLFKPKESTLLGYPEDYRLSELFEKPIDMMTFDGNHLTILENPDVAKEINKFINAEEVVRTNFVNGIDAKMFGEVKVIQSYK